MCQETCFCNPSRRPDSVQPGFFLVLVDLFQKLVGRGEGARKVGREEDERKRKKEEEEEKRRRMRSLQFIT